MRAGSLVTGVKQEPPWSEGGHSPWENLAEGLRVLAEMTGATAPDILVLSCNLWSAALPASSKAVISSHA